MRIVVAHAVVVDGQGDERLVTVLSRHGLTQVSCESGNAALTRQVVADERDAIDCGIGRFVCRDVLRYISRLLAGMRAPLRTVFGLLIVF